MADRVLVLDDDTRVFLGVVRSLGRRGLEVHAAPANLASPALASTFIAKIHRIPPYLVGPERWVERVRGLIEAHDYRLVIPCSDTMLAILSCHADALGRDRLAIPAPEVVELFTDKQATRKLAKELGVPVAQGRLLTAKDKAEAVRAEFGLPLILKPRSSATGDDVQKRYAQLVADADELHDALPQAIEDGYLCEAFFEGAGVGLSVLARGGRVVRAFQHRRLAEAIEGGSCCRIGEEVDPGLLAGVEAIVRAAGLDGVAMFEFRQNPETRKFILLEVNPRFWGSLPLALVSGADFPAALYDRIVHGSAPAWGDVACGCEKRELAGEYDRLLRRLSTAESRFPKLCIAAAEMLEWLPRLISGRVFDSWAADDKAPWVQERRLLVKLVGGRIAKRLPGSATLRQARSRSALRKLLRKASCGSTRLIFVGRENESRSPFAAALTRQKLKQAGCALEVHSAGIDPSFDRPATNHAIMAAAAYGVDLASHRSTQLDPDQVRPGDVLIAVDDDVAQRLKERSLSDARLLRLPDISGAAALPRGSLKSTARSTELFAQQVVFAVHPQRRIQRNQGR